MHTTSTNFNLLECQGAIPTDGPIKKGTLLVGCGIKWTKHIDIVLHYDIRSNTVQLLCPYTSHIMTSNFSVMGFVHINKCKKCKWGLKSILEKCTHEKFEAFNG